MLSRMSPERKNSAAGDAATVVVTASTSRRCGLCASYFLSQLSGSLTLRAVASGICCHSTSIERSFSPARR